MPRARKTNIKQISKDKPRQRFAKMKASQILKKLSLKRESKVVRKRNTNSKQTLKNKPRPRIQKMKASQNLKELSRKRDSKVVHAMHVSRTSMSASKAIHKLRQLRRDAKAVREINVSKKATPKPTQKLKELSRKRNSEAAQKIFAGETALLTLKAQQRQRQLTLRRNAKAVEDKYARLTAVRTSKTQRPKQAPRKIGMRSTQEPLAGQLAQLTSPLSSLPQAVTSQQVFYHAVLKNLADCNDSGATREEVSHTVSSMLGVCPVVMEPIVGALLSHAAASKLVDSNRGRFVPKNREEMRALYVPETNLPAPGEICTLEDIMDRTDDWLHIFKECTLLVKREMTSL